MKTTQFSAYWLRFSALLLLFWSALPSAIIAQQWTNYFGTPQVYAIATDAQGNQWFGTNTGVWKFDGTNYTHYHPTNSGLASSDVRAIAIDAQGNKWFGTFSGGVSKFDGTSWTTYTTSNSSLAHNWVNAITIDAQGAKWIGTAGRGVSKLDGTTWTTYNMSNSGFATDDAKAITLDAQGNKWFATNRGVFKFDGTTWTAYNGQVTNAIAIDAQGNKWIGTAAGVSKLDGTVWTTYTMSNSGLANNSVYAVGIDAQGNKWFGTNGGVSKWNGTTWTTYNTSNSGLTNNYIKTIAIDAQGNKWVGTNAGVSKFDDTLWSLYNPSNSVFTNNFFSSIVIDAQGNKWFGTHGGVVQLSGTTWNTYNTSNSGLTNNIVRDMAIDAQGNKWFATDNGVFKWDGSTWTNYNPSNSGLVDYTVLKIAIDAQGNKWFGTTRGVSKWDGTVWITYDNSNSGLGTNQINGIAIDAQGNKWFATTSGVFKWNGTTWTAYYAFNSGLANNYVFCVTADAQGNQWFGTYGGGVSKWDGTTWTTYNPSNSGLTDGIVASILIDAQNNKWFGTNGGVSKLSGTTWTTYNISNSGLAHNSVNTMAIDSQGNKWFGCWGYGLSKFTSVSCNLSANITRNGTDLTAIPTGGTAPFTYAWNNQATAATLQNVASGLYAVTITDSIGCTANASFTVSTQLVSSQLYQLQVTDAQCGGAQPATLHLNMNTTRSCIDALLVKIQFDSTKVFFDNNLIIQQGAAIDTSGRVFYSINRDTLLMTVDLSTGCIQGDSGTNVLRMPFHLRPTFALPRATSAFNLTVLEERILSGATRDTIHQSFEVSGTLLGKIQVFRPNANAITGDVRPVSVLVGDTCSNLNRVIAADSNAQAFARIDSFRYFKLHRPPLSAVASPLIGGYDVFLMRSYVHDGSPFTNRQRIAADVNNDGAISALDITIVRRRSVGIYPNFADYSAGRLTCDYQFTLQNSDTPKVCFRLPALAADCDTPRIQLHMITLGDINGDTDTVTSTAGIRGNDSNGIAKSNNHLTLQLCRATRVGTEWKIPVFANAVTRGLDLQLLNLPETGILRVESANPAAFEVSANAQGVGNNYYIIGYANHLQGIPANDTLLYLYVKTTHLSPLQLGSLKGYLDAQEVNTQKVICTPTSDLYTHLFEVYPNPTTSIVQLTTPQPLSEPTTLRIYDMLGRCVQTEVLQRGDALFNIDLSNLANSVYQFHFANQYQKVVKQ